jgi:hypothetical protein
MTAQSNNLNLDNVGLSVQHAKSFLELIELRLEDDDLQGRALVDAALKELEAISGEIDKAVNFNPAPTGSPVMSVPLAVH